MPSQTDLCNRALSVTGTRSNIASLSEDSKEARACSLHFEPCARSMLRLALWSFARFEAPAALLLSAQGTPENPDGTAPFPPSPWQYEYAWPQDAIRLRAVLPKYSPSGSQGGLPYPMPGFTAAAVNLPVSERVARRHQIAVDKDAAGNWVTVILSNIESAQLVYTAAILDPNLWDDEFQEAFVFMLASHLVGALIGDKQMDKALFEKAQLAAVNARAVDANEQPVSPDHTPDWIKVRGPSGYPYIYPWDVPIPAEFATGQQM